MNRYEVYHILGEFFNTYHVKVNKRNYKKLFTKRREPVGILINDKAYISGVNHCYLCNEELVIRDKYAFMQINIPYREIFDLKVFEQYDED